LFLTVDELLIPLLVTVHELHPRFVEDGVRRKEQGALCTPRRTLAQVYAAANMMQIGENSALSHTHAHLQLHLLLPVADRVHFCMLLPLLLLLSCSCTLPARLHQASSECRVHCHHSRS
jgi:hypothetical protein